MELSEDLKTKEVLLNDHEAIPNNKLKVPQVGKERWNDESRMPISYPIAGLSNLY